LATTLALTLASSSEEMKNSAGDKWQKREGFRQRLVIQNGLCLNSPGKSAEHNGSRRSREEQKSARRDGLARRRLWSAHPVPAYPPVALVDFSK